MLQQADIFHCNHGQGAEKSPLGIRAVCPPSPHVLVDMEGAEEWGSQWTMGWKFPY